MKSNLRKKLEKFTKTKRRNKIIKNIMLGIASVMVFVTVYVLILPAITAEKEDLNVAKDTVEVEISELNNISENSDLDSEDTSDENSEPVNDDADEDMDAEATDTNEESDESKDDENDLDTEEDNTADDAVDSDSDDIDVADENTDDIENEDNTLEDKDNKQNEDSKENSDVEENSGLNETQEDSKDDNEKVELAKNDEEKPELAEDAKDEDAENKEELVEGEEIVEGEVPLEDPKTEEPIKEENFKPLSENEITKLTAEELAKLEEIRFVEAEVDFEFELNEPVAVQTFSARSASKNLGNVTSGKVKAKVTLPVGYNGGDFKVIITKLPKDIYELAEKTRVFGYKVKLEKKSGEEFTNEEFVYINDAKVDFEIFDTRLKTADKNKYSLYYYESMNDSEQIAFEIEDTDLIAENNEEFVKISFNDAKLGDYVFYKGKTDVIVDTVEGVTVYLLKENLSAEEAQRLNGVELNVKTTDSVKNQYELKRKVNENGAVIEKDETLDKIFAYDLYPLKNGAVYDINPDGASVMKVKVVIENEDIKVADKDYYQVYYVENSEVLLKNKMNIVEVVDGKLTFETTHFSDYALFKSNLKNQNGLVIEDGKEIDVATFDQLLADAMTEGKTSIELANTVKIDKNYTLTSQIRIIRKAGFTKELFRVENATLNVENIIIDGNDSNVNAFAPLIVNKKGTLNLNDGAVLTNNNNQGPLTARNTEFPYRAEGGAVWSNGDLNVNGALINNNKAQSGGGIYTEGNDGHINFTMNYGDISGNSAQHYETASWVGKGRYIDIRKYKCAGGGIYLGDNVSATISGGSITNNTSNRNGGGVSLREIYRTSQGLGNSVTTTLSVFGGDFTGNTATMCGGGINVSSNTELTIKSANITGNTANGKDKHVNDTTFSGGGIYVDSNEDGKDGHLYVNNVLITENTSDGFGGGYAGCETSKTYIYSFRGALFYKNNAYSAYGDYKDLGIKKPNTNTYHIDPTMIGGFKLEGVTSSDNFLYKAGSRVTPEQFNNLNHSFDVIIKGNKGNLGGGIACNGITTIGEPTEETGDKKMAVAVTKKWENVSEEDTLPEITVILLKNGKDYDSVKLNKDNDWHYEWSNLPAANYTVKELELDGYDVTIESKSNVTKEVKKFENGFNYIFDFGGYGLKNQKQIDGLNKDWNIYFAKMDLTNVENSMMWFAELSGNTYHLTNAGTGKQLGFDYGGYWPTGFYGTSNEAESTNFDFVYDETKKHGFLRADYGGYWYYANMNQYKSLAKKSYSLQKGYYVPATYNGTATGLKLRKFIDKEFTITNTKKTNKLALQIHKVDNKTEGAIALEGAEFTLYKEAKDSTTTVTDGFTGSIVSELITNEDGQIILNDLVPNQVYFLKETKAPENHIKLSKVIVFKLDSKGKFVTLDESKYPTDKFIHVALSSEAIGNIEIFAYGIYNDGSTHLYVKNDKSGYTLPETGGIGTGLHTLLGIILMITSTGIILIKKKRKRRA